MTDYTDKRKYYEHVRKKILIKLLKNIDVGRKENKPVFHS